MSRDRRTMDLHHKYQLDRVINACGSFTPLGVSRSPSAIAESVAAALGQYFIVEQLQEVAGAAVAQYSGAEAAAVCHCAAAGITLSLAGMIAGLDPAAVAALPATVPRRNRVVIPAAHIVNYGHEITQDIRLCGGRPLAAGEHDYCDLGALEDMLVQKDVAALLLVSSRLVRDQQLDLGLAVDLAHARGVPVVVDGAAQDMRMAELLNTGADIVVFSAHKYLASPTAGLIVGSQQHVAAARAHENGIGRAMKVPKESIVGVLAALEYRQALDVGEWRGAMERKVADFVTVADRIDGVSARVQQDPAGMPIRRVLLEIEETEFGIAAGAVASALKALDPPIYVMEHEVDRGHLLLEIQSLERHEITRILEAIRSLGDR